MPMEFACRGRPAADQDGDGSIHYPYPGPPLPHDAGDAMLVIRDALLLQLQKDRLRQEIIMAELAKLESAMALRSAARHDGQNIVPMWMGSMIRRKRMESMGVCNRSLGSLPVKTDSVYARGPVVPMASQRRRMKHSMRRNFRNPMSPRRRHLH
ncbi:uncharacterized protein LOC112880079 isoform X3 [Panicum hallii]|uniref:uncharacterized protein LOC112880079 isoform X3 n=1 Tax=Panicum hallii TaxID=206008 RepID=UPI000DF4EFC8|nr:uncharacterized protein LOC112880079 isoform X3 [Panicum hallii]